MMQISPALSQRITLLFIAIFGLWIAYPIVEAKHGLFSFNLAGDGIKAAWAYDFVARQLAEGGWFSHFTDFNYPSPLPRWIDYPNLGDAILSAPLAWIFDWPQQWQATLVLVIFALGAGMVWLAYECGVRSFALFFVGAMALSYRPMWRDLALGRVNGAWLGIFLVTIAALLYLIRLLKEDISTWPRAVHIAFAALFASLLGALALTTYPPHILLILPFGALLIAPKLWERPKRSIPIIIGVLALGVALAWPELSAILERQSGLQVPCENLRCPLDSWAVYGQEMAMHKHLSSGTQFHRGNMTASVWLLLPLTLLGLRKERWIAFSLLFIGLYLYLSMGPCPSWTRNFQMEGKPLPQSAEWLRGLWCTLEPIHDFSRFLQMAGLMAILTSGVGIQAIPKRRSWMHLVFSTLMIASLIHNTWFLRQETQAPGVWQRVEMPITAKILQTLEPGPVAELPFDESAQFLSILYAPESPRVNPLNPRDPTQSESMALNWLNDMALGRMSAYTPTSTDIEAIGITYIFHDRNRCQDGLTQNMQPCSPEIIAALEAVLGPGESVEEGILLWQL